MKDTTGNGDLAKIIGIADPFHQVLTRASELAALDRPVLIVGERGTGKELIAARLHFLSQRWERPYVKLNCATLPENLLESELFGYEPGAFTGANRLHKGRFERAHQGTLFLDELGAMSLRLQEKVLRTIEYGELERLGGGRTLQVQTRIIAATNEDLPAKARRGGFRADLLDRLSFEVLTLPPLRARQDDIMLLAEHFALKMTRELGHEYFAGFSQQSKETLLAYGWPGNVRELKNVVERSVYRNDDPHNEVTTIILDPFASPYRPSSLAAPLAESLDSPAQQGEAEEPLAPTTGALTFNDQVAALEVTLLQDSLKLHHYNQKKAAQALGLSYHQLRGLLRKYKVSAHPLQ